MAVTTRREGTIAFVTLDSPPVNAIGLAVRQGLQDAIEWVVGEDGLSRVVLTGAGRAFAAGADAREFDSDPVAPHLPDILNSIEASDVPWVAAITGVALGGGCELALACRYRIAGPGVLLGFPEVTLGVIPGAGGTQRLPRLIGLRHALQMIATGKPVTAEVAEGLGLIDGVADDPVALAQALDIGSLELAMPICDVPSPAPDEIAIDAARSLAARNYPNQSAPPRAIDLMASTTTMPLSEGMRAERESFLALRKGHQARALRHLFFAERAAKTPKSLTTAPVPLDHIVVVGGGAMGAAIAVCALDTGAQVTVLEADSDGIARATANVEKIVDASRKRGALTEDEVLVIRSRLTICDDYAEARTATLAIDAAYESLDAKQTVFRELSAQLAPDAVFATCTSNLDFNAIASCVPDPSRLVGLFFIAPPNLRKLLEIVRGDATGDRAVATAFDFAKRARKVPVLAGVSDGFIGNRILARYHEAADTVFMDGSTPWDVDEAMVEFGYAMGPYEAQDLTGLDVAHAYRRRQDTTRDPARRYVPIADRMLELGKLGRKTGAGWYRYPGGHGKVEDPIVADLALEEARFAGLERTDYCGDEIRRRLLLAMINEACDILSEGIVVSARDIDLVTVVGLGFPRWRGGLMYYADTVGVGKIVAQLDDLSKEDSRAWSASPLLRDVAAQGLKLADYNR